METSTKLFVQLEPDATGLTILSRLQAGLDQTTIGRLVQDNAMHMTVLHIGLVERLITSLKPCTDASEEVVLSALDDLVEAWQRSIGRLGFRSVHLRLHELDRFGENHGTLVVRLSHDPALDELHAACLDDLITFLSAVGVANPRQCMAYDANLKHCLSLTPHISLAKGYHGALPSLTTNQPISLSLMPLVYEAR